jgi:hypothetical protein
MKRLIVLVVALLIPSGVFAKSECGADVEKFCKDMKEKSQIQACLDQHQSELSPACQARREAVKACADDAAKFCADAKKAKDRSACLDKHKDELSAGCKESRAKLQ